MAWGEAMTEEEWLVCNDPEVMLRLGWTPARKRRLFAVACCARIANVMTESGQKAVEAAEAFADGAIDARELAQIRLRVGYPNAARRDHAANAARAASAQVELLGALDAASQAVRACVTSPAEQDSQHSAERAAQTALIRDIFGNPFRPIAFSPEWRTDTVVALASQMYESRDFGAMPILADALQDAGCDSEDILTHCRDPRQVHVRGCWVVDLVLEKG
jgi:hypothetical protein